MRQRILRDAVEPDVSDGLFSGGVCVVLGCVGSLPAWRMATQLLAALPEFSSRWRTGFSHLRGGSENRTVVRAAMAPIAKSNRPRSRIPTTSALLNAT